MYLRPRNYTVARDPSRDNCELWRPFLLKKADFTAPDTQTDSPTKSVNRTPQQKTQIRHRLTPQDNNLNSSASRELHFLSLVLLSLYFVAYTFGC
ncbi:putative acetylcholinesterase [Ixodes scapularis]